jgi:hypothetical protein
MLGCERCAVMGGGWSEEGTGAVVLYGAVELWMLVFGFCRRDVPVHHAM